MTGYILLFVSAVAGVWSNLMLAECAIKHKKANYDQVVALAGGKPLQRLLQVMLLIDLFGACTGYQIIQSQMVAYIVNAFGVSQEYTDTSKFRAIANIPLDIALVIPLSIMRNISSLAFVSLLTVLALIYCALLLLVEAPWYNREYKQMENYERHFFLLDLNFLQACSMTFFAYTCQFQLLPIYSELVRPSYNRIKKVVVYSFLIDFCAYALIATAGYFSTFNYTNQIVIYRDPLPGYTPDYTMIICAVGILVVMISSYPCNFNPFRQCLFVFILEQPNYSDRANYILTIVFVTTTCVISIFVPSITSVLSIIGGLCSVSLCFLIPTICHVRLSDQPWTATKNLSAILFFGVFVVIGYTSVLATLYCIVTGKSVIGERPDIQSIN